MSDRSEIEMAHAAALKAEADWRAMRDQCARQARRIEELEQELAQLRSGNRPTRGAPTTSVGDLPVIKTRIADGIAAGGMSVTAQVASVLAALSDGGFKIVRQFDA